MSRPVVTEQAEDDLRLITAYIAEQSGALRAKNVAMRIRTAFDSLAFTPGIGVQRTFLDPVSRVFPVPPWLIVYERLPQDDGIRILRIIDGRRDLPAVFGRKNR